MTTGEHGSKRGVLAYRARLLDVLVLRKGRKEQTAGTRGRRGVIANGAAFPAHDKRVWEIKERNEGLAHTPCFYLDNLEVKALSNSEPYANGNQYLFHPFVSITRKDDPFKTRIL